MLLTCFMKYNLLILFCYGLVPFCFQSRAADVPNFYSEGSDTLDSGTRYDGWASMRYPIQLPNGINTMRELLPHAKVLVDEMTEPVFLESAYPELSREDVRQILSMVRYTFIGECTDLNGPV